MSWHLPNHYRLNTMHHAVSMALIYSVGATLLPSAAQAAVVGQAVITSAPNQPLAASMMVTDIDAADFSATLAGKVIYQEMGLTPTDSMSVRFVPASETSGQLLVTTTQPIDTPFADMVLTLNNNGQRDVIPRTLLMPLVGQAAVQPAASIMASQPSTALVANTQPLLVNNTLPPPLFDNDIRQTQPSNKSATYTASSSTVPSDRLPVTHTAVMPPLPGAPTKDTMEHQATPALLAKDTNIDKAPSEALQVQVKRKIKSPANQHTLAVDNNEAQDLNPTSNESVLVVSHQPPPELNTNEPTPILLLNPKNRGTQATKQYTVQRQDSLWLIAQQIAEQNNLNTQKVMADIRQTNSNAFVDNTSHRLKPMAQLDLSHYETVANQDKFQAAIRAKKQQYLHSIQAATKASAKNDSNLQAKMGLDQQKTLISQETRVKIRPAAIKDDKITVANTTDTAENNQQVALENARA